MCKIWNKFSGCWAGMVILEIGSNDYIETKFGWVLAPPQINGLLTGYWIVTSSTSDYALWTNPIWYLKQIQKLVLKQMAIVWSKMGVGFRGRGSHSFTPSSPQQSRRRCQPPPPPWLAWRLCGDEPTTNKQTKRHEILPICSSLASLYSSSASLSFWWTDIWALWNYEIDLRVLSGAGVGIGL